MEAKKCNGCNCINACRPDGQAEDARLDFPGKFTVSLDKAGVSVAIDPRFYRELRRERFSFNAPAALEKTALCETTADCSDARFIFCQVRRSIQSGVTSELYYESKILELLFFVLSQKDAGQKTRFLREDDYKAVSSVKQLITKNLNGCPKICDLAVLVHTCPAKLQRDFKTAFGCTIYDFVQSERLKKAAEMLAFSQAPIYSIAKSVGCKKPGRFSENFRAVYGITPSEYRKQFYV